MTASHRKFDGQQQRKQASIFVRLFFFFFLKSSAFDLIDEATGPEEAHFTHHCYSCSRWTWSSIGHWKNNTTLKAWGQSLNTRRNTLLFLCWSVCTRGSLIRMLSGPKWVAELCNTAVYSQKETRLQELYRTTDQIYNVSRRVTLSSSDWFML